MKLELDWMNGKTGRGDYCSVCMWSILDVCPIKPLIRKLRKQTTDRVGIVKCEGMVR